MIEGSEAAGLVLALCSAACYDTGYALQAIEARRVPAGHAMRPALLGNLVRRPRWVWATALSLAGFPIQVLALTKAPLTLVQPVLALGLLLLLFLGSRVLHERVGRREVVAVALVIAGVAIMATAAPAGPGKVPRDDELAIVLTLLGMVAVAPFVASWGFRNPGARRPPVWLLVVGAGAADGLAAFVAKLIAEDASAGLWFAALAWLALAAAVVAMGLIGESSALQRAAATRVAPVVLAMQIGIPVTMAPFVGGERWGSTPLGGALLAGALALALIGVILLASSAAVAGVIAEAEPERDPASHDEGG